jgi:CheY-like chemotaxis protein
MDYRSDDHRPEQDKLSILRVREKRMAKLLIFSEFTEIRELLSQEFAGDGHTVIATGNPALMRELLQNLVPDLLLLNFHLNKINPWQLMRQINKESPRLLVLPYTAYSDQDGNLRLVLAHPKGGKNLTLQAFKRNLDSFLNPGPIPGDGKSMNHGSHGGVKPGRENFSATPPAETANPFDGYLHKRRTQK